MDSETRCKTLKEVDEQLAAKRCLDDCVLCGLTLKETMQLENDLLRKQIELLEQIAGIPLLPPAPVIAV